MKRQLKSLLDIGVHIDLEYLGDISNPFVFYRSLRKTRQMAPKYDLIHSPYGSGCGYLVSKVNGPKIVTLRGSDLYGCEPSQLKAKFRDYISLRMTNMCLTEFSLIIVMSHAMKRMLCNELQEKTEVIPDGIDFDEFFPISREEARWGLGKKDQAQRWILYYPGLTLNDSNKRPSLARAAFDIVKKYVHDAQLIEIVDIPPARMNLMFNAGDVVLLTSIHEGWPNVIKEAMACNVPFVSTNVSDLTEIVSSSPGCYVAEIDTTEELAAGILRAFDTVDKYGRQDLRKNIEFLKTTYVANRLKQIYETVVNCGKFDDN
jgi:glycosyltransferase involved in cell wall biosynthesis